MNAIALAAAIGAALAANPPRPPAVMPAFVTVGEDDCPPEAPPPTPPREKYRAYLPRAAALINDPPGAPAQPPDDPEEYAALRAALFEAAEGLEIMDPRERSWKLFHESQWQYELDDLRQKRADLADAPPAGDGARFGPRAAIAAAVGFNRGFHKHLGLRLAAEPDRAGVLHEAMLETDRLYRIYDLADTGAADACYYVACKRQALKQLRELLGEEAYNRAELPPCAPFWLFNQLR